MGDDLCLLTSGGGRDATGVAVLAALDLQHAFGSDVFAEYVPCMRAGRWHLHVCLPFWWSWLQCGWMCSYSSLLLFEGGTGSTGPVPFLRYTGYDGAMSGGTGAGNRGKTGAGCGLAGQPAPRVCHQLASGLTSRIMSSSAYMLPMALTWLSWPWP